MYFESDSCRLPHLKLSEPFNSEDDLFNESHDDTIPTNDDPIDYSNKNGISSKFEDEPIDSFDEEIDPLLLFISRMPKPFNVIEDYDILKSNQLPKYIVPSDQKKLPVSNSSEGGNPINSTASTASKTEKTLDTAKLYPPNQDLLFGPASNKKNQRPERGKRGQKRKKIIKKVERKIVLNGESEVESEDKGDSSPKETTKNVIKNFSGQILRYAGKHKEIKDIFEKQIEKNKKLILTIDDLRQFWYGNDVEFSECMRGLSKKFLLKKYHRWVLNSQLKNKKFYLKMRRILLKKVNLPSGDLLNCLID